MKALLVDGLNLVRRIYAAVPAREGAPSGGDGGGENDGHLADVISSSVASLRRALQQHDPSHCLVVFDGGRCNWRHELYPDYKKNRAPMPAPLRGGMARIAGAFGEIHVRCFSRDDFEADDIIATVAAKIAARGGRALILSTDRNYCQLLGDGIAVFDHFAQRPLDREMVVKKFQVQPRQLPEFLALAGDSGASIPGVQSVGARTAAKLLGAHGGLEEALGAAESGAIRGKLGAKLRADGEHARLARKLFTLRTDLDLGINLSELRYAPPQSAAEGAH
ncbi:MAG: hypothetical protein MPK34_02955 [Gammaproteobacteria bacterium]|nr:hypothetical protein [Gammaproteobacteria bacterium]